MEGKNVSISYGEVIDNLIKKMMFSSFSKVRRQWLA